MTNEDVDEARRVAESIHGVTTFFDEEHEALVASTAERFIAFAAQAMELGVASVLRIRCLKHISVQQQNATEHGGGECGACIASERDSLRAQLGEAVAFRASVCAMLGWGNIPPQATIERDICALRDRAKHLEAQLADAGAETARFASRACKAREETEAVQRALNACAGEQDRLRERLAEAVERAEGAEARVMKVEVVAREAIRGGRPVHGHSWADRLIDSLEAALARPEASTPEPGA